MRNRRKTLLRDHLVPEVTLKACPKHTQSQLYLRPSPLEDLKDLPHTIINNLTETNKLCTIFQGYSPKRNMSDIKEILRNEEFHFGDLFPTSEIGLRKVRLNPCAVRLNPTLENSENANKSNLDLDLANFKTLHQNWNLNSQIFSSI